MSYIVERIHGTYEVEPGGKYSGRERKQGKQHSRREEHDTVSISAEAKKRCAAGEDPDHGADPAG